jgi:murein DD-endopeptidase MepM/ murein hydrolase activator NlpD
MQIEWIRNTYSISKKSCSSQVSSGTKIDGPVMPVSLIDAPGANVSSGYYRSGDSWKDKVTGLYEFHGAIDIPVVGKSGVPARAMYRVEWIEERYSKKGGRTAVMKILSGTYKDMILVYMHLDSVLLFKKDQEINAGDQIGIVGNSGGQPIIHLHLEIRPASAINSAAFEDPETRKIPIEANRENLNKFFRDRAKGSGGKEEWYPIYDNGVNLRDKA